MTEITVLEYTSSDHDQFRVTNDELERIYAEAVESQVKDHVPPMSRANVVGFISAVWAERDRPKGITREVLSRVQSASADIALRELVGNADDRELTIIAGEPSGLPKTGAHVVGGAADVVGGASDITGGAADVVGGAVDATGGAAIKMFKPFAAKTNNVVITPAKQQALTGQTVALNRAARYLYSGEWYVAARHAHIAAIGLRIQPSPWPAVLATRVGDKATSGEPVDLSISEKYGDIAATLCANAEFVQLAAMLTPYRNDIAAAHYTDLTKALSDETAAIAAGLIVDFADDTPPAPMETEPVTPFMQLTAAEFGKITPIYPNYLAEFTSYGLFPAYISALFTGADGSRTRALFDSAVEIARKDSARVIAEREKFAQREKFALRMELLRKILSPSRYAVVSRAENETMLAGILSKAEMTSLDTEYAAEVKYLRAAIDNKCGHLEKYREFRKAPSLAAKKTAWMSLSAKYVAPASLKGGKRMIECTVCGFPLACPHYVEYVRMSSIGSSAREIRDRLIDYVDESSDPDAQKCKVCHEVMFTQFDLGEDVRSRDELNDDLRRAVYVEAAQLIGAVRFNQPVDVGDLLLQIRDVVYPYAVRIDAELRHTRSLTQGDIAQRCNAYISMIIGAKLVQLVARNRDMYFEKAPKLRKVPELIDYVAGLIMTTKTIVLRDIPGITKTVIRDRIALGIAAFGEVGISPEAEAVETPEEFAERIKSDPIYWWIGEATGKDTFAGIMGESPAVVMKGAAKSGKTVYEGARLAPTVYKTKYMAALYKWFMELVKTGGHRFRADSDGIIQWDSDVPFAAESAEWNLPRRRANLRTCTLGGDSPIEHNWRFSGSVSHIGRVYDEDGHPHVWDMWKIGDSAYTVKDILRWTPAERAERAPTGIRAAVVDRVCSKCGAEMSVADKLSVERIERAIAANIEVAAFYRFYEQRCLKNGIHEGSPCTKCGLNAAANPTDRLNYYRKWKDHYLQERAQYVYHRIEPDTQPEPPPAPAVEWTERFSDITAIAKIGNIHPRMIQTFGSYEGVNVENINNGTYTPTAVSHRDDTRVTAVNAIVVNMIAAWGRIRNYNHIRSHTTYTTEIVGKTARTALASLPDIGAGYLELYNHFYWHETPDKTVSMCIQEWCSRLLAIYNHPDTETQSLCHEFVQSQIRETVQTQELYTERKPFNWSIIYGNRDMPDVVENFDPEQEDSVARDKAFSTDAFDMDGEVNLHVGDNLGLG